MKEDDPGFFFHCAARLRQTKQKNFSCKKGLLQINVRKKLGLGAVRYVLYVHNIYLPDDI